MPVVNVLILIVLSLGYYSLHRLVFLFWNWSLFKNQDFLQLLWALMNGLRFDLSAVATLALPCFLLALILWPWQQHRWLRVIPAGIYVFLQIPLMIINIGDAEFVSFMGRRFTYEALFTFRELPGKFWQIAFSYLGLFCVGVILIFSFLYFSYRSFNQSASTQKKSQLQLTHKLGLAFLSFLVLFLSARGGLQKKPLGFAHGQVFAQPMMNNLVLNSAFTLMQSSRKESLQRYQFFTDKEVVLKNLNGALSGPSLLQGQRPSQPQNIVLIIVESLSLDYMGRPFSENGFTPFLDSLSEKGVLFTNFYANGRRSIEGIASILAGIPALMNEPFLSSQYMSNYFLGLGTQLTKQGYHTSFFHGGHNGTMYFDSFIQSVGIERYYGYNEYPIKPEDDDGTWGVYDEPFLQWMLEKMDHFERPFFNSVFTLSSHNPFKIPEKYAGKFPKGHVDILESIGYTDYALEQFFKNAQTKSWYKDTLFIITGDHTHKAAREDFTSDIDRYRVPLILYHPSWSIPDDNKNEIIQQVDLLPTIMDFVGAEEKERNYLNRSLFVPGPRTAVFFNDLKYRMISKDYLLVADQNLESIKFYSSSDRSEKTELNLEEKEKKKFTDILKSHVQYFSEGLWDNKLYFPM